MKSISRDVKVTLIIAIIMSIMLPAGIVMIVLGFAGRVFFVGVIGIIFTVVGFYGTPMIWIGYSERKKLARLVYAVEHEFIYSASALSKHLSLEEKKVKDMLTKSIEKGYLKGFLFDGENLTANFNKNKKDEVIYVQCDGCGAKYSYSAGTVGKCPYCGSFDVTNNNN